MMGFTTLAEPPITLIASCTEENVLAAQDPRIAEPTSTDSRSTGQRTGKPKTSA